MSSQTRSRRDFLKIAAAGTCGGLAHQILAPTGGFMAYADPLKGAAGLDSRVFILFNFSGGVSYNLTPVYDGWYRSSNPTISYAENQSIPFSSNQGLHPSLTNLHAIYNEGNLAVLNMIGAGPRHSRSHDEATNQFHTHRSSAMGASEGWGARLTSQLQSAFGGVSFAGSNNFVRGGTNPPRVLASLGSLGEREIFYSDDDAMQLQLARTNMVAQVGTPSNPAQEHVIESVLKVQSNIDLLRAYANLSLPVTFPNTGLGRRFADAARLIAADTALNVRLIYIDQGGYDTHAGERARLTQLLNEFNGAIGPFIQTMKIWGRWNDVVIANMSEFTRTMENSSQGTDHGLAGPQLVLGGLVKGGQKTPAPTASDIGNSDFIRNYHGTFAQVYGEIVSEFMGMDAARVFNGDIAASPYFDII
jgi:uncharacterized protein (DUF1501 family)